MARGGEEAQPWQSDAIASRVRRRCSSCPAAPVYAIGRIAPARIDAFSSVYTLKTCAASHQSRIAAITMWTTRPSSPAAFMPCTMAKMAFATLFSRLTCEASEAVASENMPIVMCLDGRGAVSFGSPGASAGGPGNLAGELPGASTDGPGACDSVPEATSTQSSSIIA